MTRSAGQIFFVKICVSEDGSRFVHCFCEEVERRESHTILKNAQIPHPEWSEDGNMRLVGRKFEVQQLRNASVGVFAFPRPRPNWFLLSSR